MKMYGSTGSLPSWSTDEVQQTPDSKKGKTQIGEKRI